MMNLEKLLDIDLRTLFNPKIWIVIVGVPHTIFLALVPLMTSEANSEEFRYATFALLNSAVLVGLYFFTEGRSQARMVAIVAGSTFLWILVDALVQDGDSFSISAQLTPPFIYSFSLSFQLAPPLILWFLASISGILNWGYDDSQELDLEKMDLTEV